MCNCGSNCDEKYTSEISYDGKKKACGSNVIRPCMDLNEVIDILMTIACQKPVMYTVDKLGISTTQVIPSTTYVVPADGGGTYELQYVVDGVLGDTTAPDPFSQIAIYAKKGPAGVGPFTEIDINARRVLLNDRQSTLVMNTVFYLRDINLSPGDEIHMQFDKAGAADTSIQNGVFLLKKIN